MMTPPLYTCNKFAITCSCRPRGSCPPFAHPAPGLQLPRPPPAPPELRFCQGLYQTRPRAGARRAAAAARARGPRQVGAPSSVSVGV